MSIKLSELVSYLDSLLKPKLVKDYCPNGLQVEGSDRISKIVTGVTASEALIDAAIENDAQAILVHHGYFWKGENQAIVGMKKARLKKLLEHNISLLAYHLPIDVHPELGNNAQLASLLNIENVEPLDSVSPTGIVMKGELNPPLDASAFATKLDLELQREPLVSSVRNKPIKTIAWCSGGGQGYIDAAADSQIDAFFSGEASEQTIHSSREQNIDFFAAGHHATERCGVKRVGEDVAENLDVEVQFIDIHNPV